MLVFIFMVYGTRLICSLFLQDKNVSPCYGLECMNNGIINMDTCSCSCQRNYSGLLCDTEMKTSSWPEGSYSLLSTVFGCPETEKYGWETGHINLTAAIRAQTRQWFPERFRLLGPYHLHTIQLNFCTRNSKVSVLASNSSWPRGSYCIFKTPQTNCSAGFLENSLPLKDYRLWQNDIGGVVPDINISDGGITLLLCCRDDGNETATVARGLPEKFPFYLLKPSRNKRCQYIKDLVVTEETFSFVKTTNRTWLENDSNFTVEESDLYFNLTFCYYEPYARRECMYKEDRGVSYRGRMNVTSRGKPCRIWRTADVAELHDNNEKYMFDMDYEGDYDKNYCRQTWWEKNRPFCLLGDNTDYIYYCNIPLCDTNDDLPNIIKRNIFRSTPWRLYSPVQLIADGTLDDPTFASSVGHIEPWIQVDLQEDYEIQSITVRRFKHKPPNINRRQVTYVSKHQWDFLTFGAYTCAGPYNPPSTDVFRFQCRRPLVGTFVTLQNFVRYDPMFNTDTHRRLQISEVIIRGKATGCGKSLGIKSGYVQDFQFTSSTNSPGSYAYHARLNRAKGWCADSNDHTPYIQVDLMIPMVVQGILIQGWMDGRTARLPDNFTVEYGKHIDNLKSLLRNGKAKIFQVDQTAVPSVPQKILLPHQLLTRIFRIKLFHQLSPACVKFDLIGCPKKVEFDLNCQKGSTPFGLQVLHGHMFNSKHYYERLVTSNITLDQCRVGYLSATQHYLSYCYSTLDRSCSYLNTDRYKRHRGHRWDADGHEDGLQYGQLMCLKDISDKSSCGGLVKRAGKIVSPSYPFFYGENLNCTWSIVFEVGTYVSLELIDVSLAVEEDLQDTSAYYECQDTLTIYDRWRGTDPLVAIITDEVIYTLEGPRYISFTNKFEINFVSCHRIKEASARGFSIDVGYDDCGGCGQGQISCSRQILCADKCGYITSPDFPRLYPVSSSCQWRIQGQMGQFVKVTFDMLDVIAEDNCEGDYVSLYDIDLSKKDSLIGRFCKVNRPVEPILSSWHMMDVEFYSDFKTAGRGFRLKYIMMTIQPYTAVHNSTAVCNDTWYEYKRRCYSFRTDSQGLTWMDAERKCNQIGGHLVSINSPDEMLFLHSTIVNERLFTEQESYIGLRKFGADEFQWTDGKPLTHTEWYSGDQSSPKQPDGFDKESCTMMKISGIRSAGNWHDIACEFDNVKQYICETEDTVSVFQNIIKPQMDSLFSVRIKAGYYFQCSTGEHISRLYVCDGSPDCSDGSDEGNCTMALCPRGMFSCSDGGCVDIAFYCDHIAHCQDGSDEVNCVYGSCAYDEWRCDNGQCVASKQRCDLLVDCVDGSDEDRCERCRDPFFQCYDGQCLPQTRVCDGVVDCGGQYREDEGPQCTTNSQPSCSAWYALGAKQNGKYDIHIKDQSNSESFSVECVFDREEGVIITIIHNAMEDLTVTGTVTLNERVRYSVSSNSIAYVKSLSSRCRQRVHFDCLQIYDMYGVVSSWYDVNGKKRKFEPDPTSSCSCILHHACNKNNTRCACSMPTDEQFSLDDNEWQTDYGYLEDMERLPITKLYIDGQQRFRRIRHSIGPLECEEATRSSTISILCVNGDVVDVSHKCILEYDIYHYHSGCRDLTHLQSCENFTCPEDYVKCPFSFCIPLRLVCDGHPDCADGVDELECKNLSCTGRFKCHGNRVCIPWQQVCDEVKHCPDGDDEYFCNITCPDACFCNGSYIMCENLTLDNIKLLPPHTRLLDISDSLTKVIPNRTFSHMSRLAILDLSYLGVNGLEDMCFSGLYNLFYLDLSNNFLKEILKGTFESMRNLKVLLLKNNNILNIYPGSFEGLNALPSLDISNMYLKGLTENTFQGLTKLVSLNLSGNGIRFVEDGAFKDLEKLQILDLRRNYIREFTKELFMELLDLTHLYNDKYVFCCFRPSTVPPDNCLPKADEFSSCSDLMKDEALRISLWVLGFVSLAGNAIVLLYRCIYDRQILHRSNDLFVANLAISDFFMGVYMIIIASADTYYRGVYSLNDDVWRGTWLCQMAGFLSALSSETSVIFLCIITLERVLVIRFPFRNFSHNIKKYSLYICLSVWIIGILFAGIPLLPLSYFSGSFYSRSGVCLALPLTSNRHPGWEYSTIIFVFWNFICFVFIAFGQAVIYHAVKASQKMRKGRTSNDMVIARKLSFIVLTDFVCWFPICVMGLMALRGHAIESEVYAWVAVFVLPINSALNPIIYTLSSIDAMRKRKVKRDQSKVSRTNDSTERYTWTSERHQKKDSIQFHLATRKWKPGIKKDFSEKMYMGLNQPSSCCLTTHMTSLTSARDIITFAYKLALSLNSLHAVCLVCGEVDADKVFVSVENGIVNNVFLSCRSSVSDTEEERDIIDFGHLLSKMIRVCTMSKAQRVV